MPLVLVVTVVMAMVVVAMADYATTTLKYGQSVEEAADRLASAQAGLDNALESIKRNESACTLTAIETNGNVPPFQLGFEINEINPVIECVAYSGTVTPVDNFALILTGGGGQTGPMLAVSGGGAKTIAGNVFMNAVPAAGGTVSLGSDLLIESGNIEYYAPSGTCLPTSQVIQTGGRQISFSPVGYGLSTSCSQDWIERFDFLRPTQPATFPGAATYTDEPSGCRVFQPGVYQTVPSLAEWNYFRSGNYLFSYDSEWLIDDAWVLAGRPGTPGPDIEDHDVDSSGNLTRSISWYNNPCRSAAEADSTGGAGFYFAGSSRITVGNRASLEVTGRRQDQYNVALLAMEGSAGTASTLNGNDRLLQTNGGNGKQLSVHGLVWAPNAGFQFSNLANDVTAALTGGAVVSELDIGAANVPGLTIRVETQEPTRSFTLRSTATNTGTTTIEAQLLYRVDGTNVDYALLSRRVVGLTP